MSSDELLETIKDQQDLRRKDYDLGYKIGWKDGVADLLKKQMEQAEAEERKNEEAEDYRQK